MAGSYDGYIRISTLINSIPLENGLSQIENKVKGLAATIGLAFGTKELLNFGQASIDAASDLAEAQNVVDTAFGSMSYKMEKFAAIALDTYGISELTAKNMGSTYMAMANGMGVATDAASDMAVTLTARLSDIMSFYNKTQEQVDTIGRAVITGETEPIKAIGVVMTQANLEAYALAKGLNKAYSEMSAQEQLLIRYKYFLEQTSLAEGDFAKTSEGWANQTRLLSERLNQFMTNLGNVLINIFTPAVRLANEAVMFLNDLFFGGNADDTTAANNAQSIADEVESVGTAADKSSKKLNNLLSGFDELHIISGAKSDDDETAGIDTSGLLGVNLDADTSTANKAANKYKDIINEMYLAFKHHPLTKLVEQILYDLGRFFGHIKENEDIGAGEIVDTVMDILAAFLAFKAISGVVGSISAFSKGLGGLISFVTANPVAAAVIGITALVAALSALESEMRHQNLVDSFGDISISLEELRELTDPISEDFVSLADSFKQNSTKINTAKDSFLKLSKAVGITMDSLDDADSTKIQEFAEQFDDLITAALGYTSAVTDTTPAYEMFLMDDGVIDENEQSILDSLSDLGTTTESRIETIREQIHSITQAAADENRSLVESEIENIKHLYDELARITATQNGIENDATWERLANRAYTYNSYEELMDQIMNARELAQKARDEIEQSQYEAMMSQVNMMRSNGYSESSIEQFKSRMIAEIQESLDAMEQESLMYEKRVLQSYHSGRFSNWEDKYFDDTARGMLSAYNIDASEKNLSQLRRYYNLIKLGVSPAAISNLAEQLGEIDLLTAANAMTEEMHNCISGIDSGYEEFLEEYNAVNEKCVDRTQEEADAFQSNLTAVLNSSDNFDPKIGEDFLAAMTSEADTVENGGKLFYDAAERAVEQVDAAQKLLSSDFGYYGSNKTMADYWSKLTGSNSSPYYGSDPNMAAYWANLKEQTQPYYAEQNVIKTESTLNINLLINDELQEQMSLVGNTNTDFDVAFRTNYKGR